MRGNKFATNKIKGGNVTGGKVIDGNGRGGKVWGDIVRIVWFLICQNRCP